MGTWLGQYCINVTDLDRAVAFYETLGLECTSRTDIEHAREAMRRAGIEPIEKPIRGGTDGSRLSFMGLPTPNLFAGEHNFHSRLEWTSRQDLERATALIVELARVWTE